MKEENEIKSIADLEAAVEELHAWNYKETRNTPLWCKKEDVLSLIASLRKSYAEIALTKEEIDLTRNVFYVAGSYLDKLLLEDNEDIMKKLRLLQSFAGGATCPKGHGIQDCEPHEGDRRD